MKFEKKEIVKKIYTIELSEADKHQLIQELIEKNPSYHMSFMLYSLLEGLRSK